MNSMKCKNCIYCHELWYWTDYPQGKQFGFCCTMLKDTGDDVVMQLQNIERDFCEMYTEIKNDH